MKKLTIPNVLLLLMLFSLKRVLSQFLIVGHLKYLKNLSGHCSYMGEPNSCRILTVMKVINHSEEHHHIQGYSSLQGYWKKFVFFWPCWIFLTNSAHYLMSSIPILIINLIPFIFQFDMFTLDLLRQGGESLGVYSIKDSVNQNCLV